MAKKNIKSIEVNDAKTVKPYIMQTNVGSNPDGTPRYPKGSEQLLTDAQIEAYSKLNYIKQPNDCGCSKKK